MPDHTATKQPEQTARKAQTLFFAAIPPAEINVQMASLWQSFGAGEPFRHDVLHHSLHGIAEKDDLDSMLVHAPVKRSPACGQRHSLCVLID